MQRAALLVVIALLSACASKPCCTDFVSVTPVRYGTVTTKQGYVVGWNETDVESATAFNVRVGNKQYFSLFDRVGEGRIVDELATYAEHQVVDNGYCKSGIARTKYRGITGPYTGEYVTLLVECHAESSQKQD